MPASTDSFKNLKKSLSVVFHKKEVQLAVAEKEKRMDHQNK
ncbi:MULTISPECIES: hypothetical protein [Bacillus amyloliquefaciens group]|nr:MULTISPECIES: hypothetical protein [Bacillus amyloliquefaciens group]MDF3267300.1 hypothetical protein [Bacillus velezensis]MED2911885.1 hypothetical protein [Bacillus velezensis]